jgi:hypothetical protein
LVAHAIGRNLTRREGCAVQAVAIVLLFVFIYWLFASGTFVAIITPLVEWYSHQVRFGPTPTPS